MSYPAYIFAVFILLLSPGPTNTLVGLASARKSFWVVLRLLPAELLGYLTMILPLTWLGGELITRWPEAALVLKAAAAIWVMYLAIKLWLAASRDVVNHSVTARRIFVTTTLNPKALVFGLVLLPQSDAPDILPKLLIFVVLASIVAVVWCIIGRLTQVGVPSHFRQMILHRTASVWLAIVSCTVVVGLFHA
ncbi:hypothetical protein CO652_23170 [Rhizobium sp. H4]|uniref:LysE family translocator n=1 Tax=Rhizobium sp. H4 TaxID=2035449 RepID=UPI000BE92D51|nr:LysE family transporter [Rhizobium sp. H4]PDV86060.1 hypothetical protein CO652_23170 [Rhizobium sp. H4]